MALEDASDEHHEEALRFRDQELLSFTDCVSFVVMQEQEISEVFALDRHFQQMGFRTVPWLKRFTDPSRT